MPIPMCHLTCSAALLFTLHALINGTNAIQLFPSAGAVPAAIPAPCASALRVNITCPELVPTAFISAQRFLDNATLASICTSTCSPSLLAFRAQVEDVCGTEAYAFTSTVNETVQQIVDPLVWAYNVSCLMDGDAYCLPEVSNVSIPIAPCSECALLYGAAMLDSTYGQMRIDLASFSSTLSSCGVPASSFPYTMPSTTTAAASTTASVPIATCSGTLYTVSSGDTCETIADAQGIATDRFITLNNLDYNCSNLVLGSEVCLGSSCALYQIATNDTCDGILEDQTFYLTQLLPWNPTIHQNCDNLCSMVGREICVSTLVVPSTNFGTIHPQTATPTYNTTWFTPTATLNISTSTVTVDPAQVFQFAALTVDCPITDDDYAAGWSIYDLPTNCTDALVEYCQPAMNATQPPPTSFPATCSPIYYENSTTPEPSTTMVPSTTSSTLAPTQSGIAANCDAFYTVQSGDSCSGITDKFSNFTLAQFYSWNPAVGSSCQYLDLGYAVCIGVISLTASSTMAFAPATSSTASLAATSSTTVAPSTTVPSPLEPSTDPQCAQYHQVVSGDSCYAIEQTYGITAVQFNEWNPYVGTSCASLWLGYYVCVGAPSSERQ